MIITLSKYIYAYFQYSSFQLPFEDVLYLIMFYFSFFPLLIMLFMSIIFSLIKQICKFNIHHTSENSTQQCQNQIFELSNSCSPSTGFELTPLMHCSTNPLALCSASQTTRSHPLCKNIASIVEVLFLKWFEIVV